MIAAAAVLVATSIDDSAVAAAGAELTAALAAEQGVAAVPSTVCAPCTREARWRDRAAAPTVGPTIGVAGR